MINSVGSSSSPQPAAATVSGGGKMGKHEFLQLFVAQMKNQDPMSPMKGDELAAQLAQFSSVEQLVSLNKTLEAQVNSNQAVVQALHNSSAMNMIGRTVHADGNLLEIPASGNASVTVDVGNAGGQGVLRIFDLNGREVGSRDLGNVPGGRRTVDIGSAGDGLPAGPYTYKLEITDTNKEPVRVVTYSTGKVDGIRYDSEGPVLSAGGMLIPLSAVIEVLPGA